MPEFMLPPNVADLADIMEQLREFDAELERITKLRDAAIYQLDSILMRNKKYGTPQLTESFGQLTVRSHFDEQK